MPIVKLEAFRRFRCAIERAVPALEGRVCIGQASDSKVQSWPHLEIDPIRFTYLPYQADEVHDPGPGRVVLNVGVHQARVQLRLGAKTPGERWELEAQLLDLLLGGEDSDAAGERPGVLVTPVTACPELGEFVAAWELEEDEFQDAKAFDRQFYTIATVTGLIPALVTRTGAWTIDALHLGMTEDLEREITAATFYSDPTMTVVEVREDGTLVPV